MTPTGAADGLAPRPAHARRNVLLLTRQRIVGSTNGSSAYLLSLLRAVGAAGCDVHLLCPSPAMFGRWPWLRLRTEMALFRSITVRRGLRLGEYVIALDPAVWARAAAGVAGQVLGRAGLRVPALTRPAPYAVAVPWRPADHRFVARHAAAKADAILCDYLFLAEGIPSVGRPDAPSAIVQHDLFHTRSGQFAAQGSRDSVAALDAAQEWRMLAQADAVIAIQEKEAAATAAALPGRRVILAPMAVAPVPAPQPGRDGTLLFVGSNTAPNVGGLEWLLRDVWPRIHAADPAAELHVAGSVCGTVGNVPEGVRLLGLVPDLAPHMAEAGVVMSPLLVGSGLKIKLVEALGAGKAVVATPVTMQGVEDLSGTAVLVADDPAGFADAVLSLLRDGERRAALAQAALDAARARFSPAACYGEVVEFLAGR